MARELITDPFGVAFFVYLRRQKELRRLESSDSEGCLASEERGARSVVLVHAERISDSCGYSVPLYDFVAHRTRLVEWADDKTEDELVEYRIAKNSVSIDGLPALS